MDNSPCPWQNLSQKEGAPEAVLKFEMTGSVIGTMAPHQVLVVQVSAGISRSDLMKRFSR